MEITIFHNYKSLFLVPFQMYLVLFDSLILSHHILNRLFYFCKYKISNLTLSIQYLLYLIVLTFTELVMCSVFSLDFYHDSLFSPMHTVVLVLPPCNCLSVTLWEWFRNVCKVFP